MSVLIVVDTETTSKYPGSAKILAAAAVVIRDGVIQPERFSTMSNPGLEALDGWDAKEALAVNGITREEVAAAPPEDEAREKFKEFLKKYEGAELTSFNTHYDKNVLNNNGWLPDGIVWSKCIMLEATRVMGDAGALPLAQWKNEYKWASLKAAAEFFGIERGRSHSALDDALTAAGIWISLKIAEKGRGGAYHV
jgi:DNA polymerase III epsilon subunit-like protein